MLKRFLIAGILLYLFFWLCILLWPLILFVFTAICGVMAIVFVYAIFTDQTDKLNKER